MQSVTLGSVAPPFVFDLFLHGDLNHSESPIIRVANLDIRKFLHPSIAKISETDSNATRLQAYFSEFSRNAKIVYPLDKATASKIASLKIINNCREPGNYEVELTDGLHRPLLRANFSFHSAFYDPILTRFHGIGIREQGTGIHVSNTVRNKSPLRYWDSFLPWNWMKSFPKVSIDVLSILRSNDVKQEPITGKIDRVSGEILFREYEIEVRNKSEYHQQSDEPLSYIQVDSKLPIPTGFESPKEGTSLAYWTDRANVGLVVPHHFRTFEDVQRYAVFLSEFDLNGVYLGKSELLNVNRERKNGRWPFHFQYLKAIRDFELRSWKNGNEDQIEIRLISPNANGVNFMMGNFALGVGQERELLFGIGTQPLIAAYNHNLYQDRLPYALAYNADGIILDHHDLKIGVERAVIERIDFVTYRVRLVSYERILPVWEGVIRISPKQRL